jgi:hypothetical protein
MGYELGDGARGGTFVLANVQNNEFLCFRVSVSVDGDEGGDGYSPLGDFELEGGDDNYLEDDKTARHGFEDNGDGAEDDETEDDRESEDV